MHDSGLIYDNVVARYAVLVGLHDIVCLSSLIDHLKRNQKGFTRDQGEENEEGIQLPKRLKLTCAAEGGQHTFVKKKCQDIRLSWKRCCALPETVSTGSAVTSGNMLYFVSSDTSPCKVYEYEMSENIWCNEIQCPHSLVSLAVLSGLLTLIGGGNSTLLSLVENPTDGTKQWSESFKPMLVKRYRPATASNGKHLIVAGGDLRYGTVEVMTIDTQEWHDTSSLPKNDGNIGSATIIGDNTFVHGSITSCCSTVTCSITKLLGKSATQSIVKPLLWQKLPEGPPLYKPRTVQLCGNLLAIGGQVTSDYDYNDLKNVYQFKGSAYIYNEEEGGWSFVCRLPSKIGYPDHNFVVASLSDDRIMVMGGTTYTNEDETPSSDIVHMGSIF